MLLRNTLKLSQNFGRFQSSTNLNLINVDLNPSGAMQLKIHFTPMYEEQLVVIDPSFSIQNLADLIKSNSPESNVQVTFQKQAQTQPEQDLSIVRFLQQQTAETLVINVNDSYKYYLPNAASHSPYQLISKVLNEHQADQYSAKAPSSIAWFNECMKHQVPSDQANFLGQFLMSFQQNVQKFTSQNNDNISKQKMQELIEQSMAHFSEPKQRAIQRLMNQKLHLQTTLQELEEELQGIESGAERRIVIYLYLIVLISMIQFAFFYYTIFQVDWLGWDIMEPLTYSCFVFQCLVALRFFVRNKKSRSAESLLNVHRHKQIMKNSNLRFRYQQVKENMEHIKKDIKYVQMATDFYESRESLL